MINKKRMKRLLCVMLSVAMACGVITVAEPQKAEAKSESDFVAYQDFETASDYEGKWRNQSTNLGKLEVVTDMVRFRKQPYYL